ncbi:hypothetical protein [Hydrogenophaga sp.]|uniref:hypothetical protein n=1 Tax=Hydrogenophaga sp. TaxID=1904254 RepID=UPI00271A96D9|nr:hypothetical protein [Hydrogenophaga sp.]MDO9438686.1 hypothetical protein [Hydrogenophaga sp.]
MACSKGIAQLLKVCLPVTACRGKLPLQQSANNQHKAKIEPGKSFFKSEPHSEVKFHKKPETVLQNSAKFKSSLSQFSPGEIAMPNGHRPFPRLFRKSIAY